MERPPAVLPKIYVGIELRWPRLGGCFTYMVHTLDDPNAAAYRTYCNYVRATARLIEQEYSTDGDLAASVVSTSQFKKIGLNRRAHLGAIFKALRQSWFTELLICEEGASESLWHYAAPWAFVQMYYAAYLAVNAFFMALGRPAVTRHKAALNNLSAIVFPSRGPLPPPWCTTLPGDPALPRLRLANCPYSVPITLKNALTSLHRTDPWQHYGLFLKTTRDRQLAEAIANWKQNNKRKRISSQERAAVLTSLRATTLFDGLYRLRARSNYLDIDAFAFAISTPEETEGLHRAICHIVDTTLLVLEAIVARAIGIDKYQDAVDLFLTACGEAAEDTVVARWSVIQDAFNSTTNRA